MTENPSTNSPITGRQASDASTTAADGKPAQPSRLRRAINSLLRMVLAVLVFGYLAMAVMLYFAQDSMVYPKDMALRVASPKPPARTQTLKVEIAPGEFVEAWFTPAPGASAQNPAPLLVHFHGNGEVIDNHNHAVEQFNAMGWSVLMPEYRGYGRSAGEPSQYAIRQDAIAFIKQALARPDVDKTRIVYYGRSLGGGVASDVSTQLPPNGLILCATFSSVVDMAWEMWMPSFLVRHPYRTDEFLKTYNGKVLIVHGVHDRQITVSHAKKNMHAASNTGKNPTYLELNCEHNDFPGHDPKQIKLFWDEVQAFLKSTK